MPSSADNISLLRPNQYIHAIYSPTAYESHLEVSAELHLPNAETLNLTLYGRSNHSSLHLYPPEDEEEEEENKGGDEGQRKAFYCCLPFLPNSESPNQSRCLLWFTNQTVWNSTAKEKLPWKRTQKGWCQADGAGLLWSPRGKCGFTVRWKGEERGDNRRQGNWPLSFHFIPSCPLSQSTMESFFLIEEISFSSSPDFLFLPLPLYYMISHTFQNYSTS